MVGRVGTGQMLHAGHWNCTKWCLEDLVIMLYREEIMWKIIVALVCANSRWVLLQKRRNPLLVCAEQRCNTSFSRKMLTSLSAFRWAFSEAMLTHQNAEENDARCQLLKYIHQQKAISVSVFSKSLYDSSFIVCIQIRADNCKEVSHGSCSSCENRVAAVWKFRS